MPKNRVTWICGPGGDGVQVSAQNTALAVLSVQRLGRRLRPTPNCLIQSLALRDLLARLGQASQIHLHVRRSDTQKFEFHAVVLVDNKIVLGQQDLWDKAPHLRHQAGL